MITNYLKITVFGIMLVACKQPNDMKPLLAENLNRPEKSLEQVMQEFDDAYKSNDLEAMFANVDTAAVFYGTDPAESWNYASFKAIVKNHFDKNLPKMSLENATVMYNDDKTAVMAVRKLNWELYKTPLREDMYYTLQNNRWMLRGLTLSLMLDNKKTSALNDALK